MKLVKVRFEGEEFYASVGSDGVFAVAGDIFGEFTVTDKKIDEKSAVILPPVNPTKIVAVGLNYRDHAEEFGEEIPDEPKIFMKPSTAVIGHKDYIVLPKQSKKVDYEAELAIVIKKEAHNVEPSHAEDYILGYTCLNDVTARDLQRKDGQWIRGKGFDTFAPIGPVIANEIDADNLDIKLLLNNEVKQHSNTKNFIFKTKELVSFISKIMTLLPGDVITTGTPSGVGQIKPGDEVKIVIENVGELISYVKE